MRALCDEMSGYLRQANALLLPIGETYFDEPFRQGGLQDYFLALETIIERVIETKEDIHQLIHDWQQQSSEVESSSDSSSEEKQPNGNDSRETA